MLVIISLSFQMEPGLPADLQRDQQEEKARYAQGDDVYHEFRRSHTQERKRYQGEDQDGHSQAKGYSPYVRRHGGSVSTR